MNRKKLTTEQKLAIRRREQRQWAEQLVLEHPAVVTRPRDAILA